MVPRWSERNYFNHYFVVDMVIAEREARQVIESQCRFMYRAPAHGRGRVANVWQNCIEVNGKAGPVVSTVLALPMPPWKRCSKFLEH